MPQKWGNICKFLLGIVVWHGAPICIFAVEIRARGRMWWWQAAGTTKEYLAACHIHTHAFVFFVSALRQTEWVGILHHLHRASSQTQPFCLPFLCEFWQWMCGCVCVSVSMVCLCTGGNAAILRQQRSNLRVSMPSRIFARYFLHPLFNNARVCMCVCVSHVVV